MKEISGKKKGAVAEQAELSGLLIIHEKERTILPCHGK